MKQIKVKLIILTILIILLVVVVVFKTDACERCGYSSSSVLDGFMDKCVDASQTHLGDSLNLSIPYLQTGDTLESSLNCCGPLFF